MPTTQHRNHTFNEFGTVSVNTYPLNRRAVYGISVHFKQKEFEKAKAEFEKLNIPKQMALGHEKNKNMRYKTQTHHAVIRTCRLVQKCA